MAGMNYFLNQPYVVVLPYTCPTVSD
jgi:hypothetical protein